MAPICSTSLVRSERPAVAAKLAEREGRAAAEIIGHIDAAAHGDIGARAGAGHAAEFQNLSGLDGKRLPIGHGLAVERRDELAPVRQITVSLLNFSVGPESVVSIAAAPSSLPTSRLASRNDSGSMGPEGGTPTAQ